MSYRNTSFETGPERMEIESPRQSSQYHPDYHGTTFTDPNKSKRSKCIILFLLIVAILVISVCLILLGVAYHKIQKLNEDHTDGVPSPSKAPEKSILPCEQFSNIALVLLDSPKEKKNFFVMKTFLSFLVSGFSIEDGKQLLSLVTYDFDAVVEFEFGTVKTSNEVQEKIEQLRYQENYGADLTDALNYLPGNVFDKLPEDRKKLPDIPNIVVVITDFINENDEKQLVEAADYLRSQTNALIVIISSGLGQKKELLQKIAGSDDNVFNVDDISTLRYNEKLATAIQTKICQYVPPAIPTICTPVTEPTTRKTTEKLPPSTKEAAFDMIFVLDTSNVMTKPGFEIAQNFILKMSAPYKISKNLLRPFIIDTSNINSLPDNINAYNSQEKFDTEVRSLIWMDSNLDLDLASSLVKITQLEGYSKDRAKIIVVIASQKSSTSLDEVTELLKDQKFSILAVGVGEKADEAELVKLAGSKDFYQNVGRQEIGSQPSIDWADTQVEKILAADLVPVITQTVPETTTVQSTTEEATTTTEESTNTTEESTTTTGEATTTTKEPTTTTEEPTTTTEEPTTTTGEATTTTEEYTTTTEEPTTENILEKCDPKNVSLDLALLIQCNEDYGEDDYHKLMNFLTSGTDALLRSLTFDPTHIRTILVFFGGENLIPLDPGTGIVPLESSLTNSKHYRPLLQTGSGLDEALKSANMSLHRGEMRKDIPNVMLVFDYSSATNIDKAAKTAKELKYSGETEIIDVALSSFVDNQKLKIATRDEFAFTVNDFNFVPVKELILRVLCRIYLEK